MSARTAIARRMMWLAISAASATPSPAQVAQPALPTKAAAPTRLPMPLLPATSARRELMTHNSAENGNHSSETAQAGFAVVGASGGGPVPSVGGGRVPAYLSKTLHAADPTAAHPHERHTLRAGRDP